MTEEMLIKYFNYDFKEFRLYYPKLFNTSSTTSPWAAGYGSAYQSHYTVASAPSHAEYLKDKGLQYSPEDLNILFKREKDKEIKNALQEYIKTRLIEIWEE